MKGDTNITLPKLSFIVVICKVKSLFLDSYILIRGADIN